jgi:hypothetical protein
MDDKEELEIECPEGYGHAILSFFLREHIAGGIVDKRIVHALECDIQDSLLKQNKNCGFRCENSSQFKSLKNSLEQ